MAFIGVVHWYMYEAKIWFSQRPRQRFFFSVLTLFQCLLLRNLTSNLVSEAVFEITTDALKQELSGFGSCYSEL